MLIWILSIRASFMTILLEYLKRYWKLLLMALLLAAINQTFSLLDPAIFGILIDKYTNDLDQYTQSQFVWGVMGLLGMSVGAAMVSRLAKNFQDYYVNVITKRIGADMYTDGISHSLSLPYQVFEDQRSGETLGIIEKVRNDVEQFITKCINTLFTSIVGITFVIIYSVNVYWIIAPLYFSTIPILAIISTVLSRRIKKIQVLIVAETTSLAGSTTESLRNIELVKSLGLVNQEIKRLDITTEKILNLELKKVKHLRSLSFIQGTCVNFLRTLIILLMLYLIFLDKISVGQFFTLFMYSFYVFSPLQQMGEIINLYRETEVSLSNFADIMKTPQEKTADKPVRADQIDKLYFKNVKFQHKTALYPALQNISFDVKKGETVAFVGPSGAGKTTLVKILVGLYLPHSGDIIYNDINRKDIDLEHLRQNIGFVTQDTQLFSGSVRENLLFVAPDASDEDCWKALKMAACGSLMDRAKDGLNTLIGEGGVKISGGEKQRLSIARALLRQPDIMVFDEATSALDSLTEESITETIRLLAKKHSQITILIAHRLSTIMHSDRIYVLEKGNIIESGNHNDLLSEKGLYYAMWRQQIGER